MNTSGFVDYRLALIAALSVCLVAGAKAQVSQTTINFVELSNNFVQATGANTAGGTLNAVGANPEVFHLSTPSIPFGYPADATLSHIGLSRSAIYYLANIYDSPGGPLSDQVYVYQYSEAFTVMDFISDPSMFVSLSPTSSVIETGSLQNALNYFNDRGELVTVNIQSSDVPDGGSAISLLSLGLLSLAALRFKLA
jgi:hypothetical protein